MYDIFYRSYSIQWRLIGTAVLFLLIFLLSQAERQLQAALPSSVLSTFFPPEGYYQRDIAVTMAALSGQVIFTTDGSTPTLENGSLYQRPVPISITSPGVTLFTARALLPDGTLGPITRATYFTIESHLPILSLATDPANLWDEETGLYVNHEERGREWERPLELTYLERPAADGSRQIAFHISAGMRIHGFSSRWYDKKSLRVYFRREYGAAELAYPLLTPYDTQVDNSIYKSLVLHSGGQDFERPYWSLLRAHLVGDIADELNGYTSQTQPVLLFLNGDSQGIYNIRNHFREPFFSHAYGIDINIANHPEQWDHFLNFLDKQNLADPVNYAYVQSQMDIANFIDYNAVQLYIASTDWLFTNVDIFRANTPGGRWFWAFWDVDWSFGLLSWGGYDFDMLNWMNTDERYGMDIGSLPLRKLLETPEFQQQFLIRTADLLNTTLSPEQVTARIDALAAELRPDIVHEIGRWPGPGDWETGVSYMKEFARHRPDYLRQQLVEHLGLPGTAEFRITPPAAGEGQVAINGTLLPPEWTGVYFMNTTVTVTAVPASGYRFVGWQTADLPANPVLTILVTQPQTFTPIFAPADLTIPQPGDVQITSVNLDTHTIEFHITRRGGLDMRGWQLTDNDTKTSTDEGSITFPNHPALADLPSGTRLSLATTDNTLTLNGNSIINFEPSSTNYRFHLGPNDNIALLTPDNRGIAFAVWGQRPFVTPHTFGILADGVTAVTPTIIP